MIKTEEVLHLFGLTNPTAAPITDRAVAKKIVSRFIEPVTIFCGYVCVFFFAGNSEQNFSSPDFPSTLNAGLPSVYMYMIFI